MKTTKQILNSIARKNGYGTCTSFIIDESVAGYTVDHTPWGFETYSGRWFPGVRTTRWFKGGYYVRATTTIKMNSNTARMLGIK